MTKKDKINYEARAWFIAFTFLFIILVMLIPIMGYRLAEEYQKGFEDGKAEIFNDFERMEQLDYKDNNPSSVRYIQINTINGKIIVFEDGTNWTITRLESWRDK